MGEENVARPAKPCLCWSTGRQDKLDTLLGWSFNITGCWTRCLLHKRGWTPNVTTTTTHIFLLSSLSKPFLFYSFSTKHGPWGL